MTWLLVSLASAGPILFAAAQSAAPQGPSRFAGYEAIPGFNAVIMVFSVYLCVSVSLW